MSYNIVYFGKVAGVSYEPAKSNLSKAVKWLKSRMNRKDFDPKIRLAHNPENKYDKNAIEVHLSESDKEYFIGHVPKTVNIVMLKLGLKNLDAELDSLNEFDGSVTGATIKVSVKE